MSSPRPFQVDIPVSEYESLQHKLAETRLPETETVDDWSQGVPLGYAREFLDYWQNSYDMQRLARRINAHPQFTMTLDGLDIHFLHIRSPHSNAKPLLMTHGWPGSQMEFMRVIEPLTQPEKHGGSADDAFHLVLPSLPGYGFSAKPTATGWGVEKTAREWMQLMANLGYRKYVAQGGDWGSAVTTAIGYQNDGNCQAIHLNMVTARPDPDTMDDLTPLEQRAVAGIQHYQDWDSGYSKQQSTRPQTLGYALVDSPMGQAMWIVEKFWSWMDCDGHPENVLTRDELLDNVMMYWLTASGASSGRLYWESFNRLGAPDVPTPMGGSIFPKEIFTCSRRWADKRFKKIIYWNELDKGGHFAAFEQPDVFVGELRDCFRSVSTL